MKSDCDIYRVEGGGFDFLCLDQEGENCPHCELGYYHDALLEGYRCQHYDHAHCRCEAAQAMILNELKEWMDGKGGLDG